MEELFTNNEKVIKEVTQNNSNPLREERSFSLVLEFFVKTVKLNISLN
jgi:hypothetical protein